MHDSGLVDPTFIHRKKKLLERHRALLRPLRSRAANWRHGIAHRIGRNDMRMDVDDLRWHGGNLDVWSGRSRVDEELIQSKHAGNEPLLERVKNERFDAAPADI